MLMWLAEYLTQFESGFRAFQYLTLRGILAAGTALAISLLEQPHSSHSMISRRYLGTAISFPTRRAGRSSS